MDQASVSPPLILAAICNVTQDMAKIGVAKTRTNSSQGFQYRGIDDVMDALAPVIAKHGVVIIPHVLNRTAEIRETRGGGQVMHVTMEITYDFKCVSDGSFEVVGPIWGEAFDSGDKATNKAMSVAYKYATTQTFCITFSALDDPDAQSHELRGRQDDGHSAEPQRESHSVAASVPPSSAPSSSPGTPIPVLPRPTGAFGYGKRYVDTPWHAMSTSQLEWFLDAERTPAWAKDRITAELQWREYDASLLDAADDAHRESLKQPFDDKVPY